MIVHIALFRWKKDVSGDQTDKLMGQLKDLKNKVDVVVDLYAGENYSKWNEGYTHAVIVITNTKDDLETYRKHSAHLPIAKMVNEMEEKSMGIDFEA